MIVAFGPPEDFQPVVPVTLVERGNDGLFLVRRDKRVATTEEKLEKFLLLGEVAATAPFAMRSGYWPLVGAAGPEWIPLADEWKWRTERGRSMLTAALSLTDAEARVQALYAAANVSGVKLSQLLHRLETSKARPDEDLADVFMRVRPAVPGRP